MCGENFFTTVKTDAATPANEIENKENKMTEKEMKEIENARAIFEEWMQSVESRINDLKNASTTAETAEDIADAINSELHFGPQRGNIDGAFLKAAEAAATPAEFFENKKRIADLLEKLLDALQSATKARADKKDPWAGLKNDIRKSLHYHKLMTMKTEFNPHAEKSLAALNIDAIRNELTKPEKQERTKKAKKIDRNALRKLYNEGAKMNLFSVADVPFEDFCNRYEKLH